MQLPEPLLKSLEPIEGFNRAAFEAVHQQAKPPVSIRINPGKFVTDDCPFIMDAPVLWTDYGFYLKERPSFTFDPLFHAGCYYVQEPSSMFLEQAMVQLADISKPLRVLDLCAAPGGKSTHLHSLVPAGSLLVSNEVVRSRASILKQNIVKWGCTNVVVTNNDPQQFAQLENFFDVLVVDAPCSGSGLFRKDPDALNEWSPDAVQHCSARQKRILADAIPALRQDGLLLYATCSYSPEEDEWIADWLVCEQGLENLSLSTRNEWGIVETASPAFGAKGYRFFPHRLQGEGFYMACFRKKTGGTGGRWKAARLEKPSARDLNMVRTWLQPAAVEIFLQPWLYAIPESLVEAYRVVRQYLNVQYAGTAIGTVMKERLVPEHALALSAVLGKGEKIDLDYDTAIKYLQRAALPVQTGAKGWQAVSYRKHNIGWINALQNRINNYYPKEMRILKQEVERRLDK